MNKSYGLSDFVFPSIKTEHSFPRLQIFSRIKGTKGCAHVLRSAPSPPQGTAGKDGGKAQGGGRAQCGLWTMLCSCSPQLGRVQARPRPGDKGQLGSHLCPSVSPFPADSCWDFRARSPQWAGTGYVEEGAGQGHLSPHAAVHPPSLHPEGCEPNMPLLSWTPRPQGRQQAGQGSQETPVAFLSCAQLPCRPCEIPLPRSP